MKTLKRATQRNLKIENYYYDEMALEYLVERGELFKIDTNFEGDVDDGNYRLDLDDVKEIKVILDDSGFYRNIAIGKNDRVYYVEL